MKNTHKKLLQVGIYPYGSEELRLFENRLTRYFNREYQRLIGNEITLEDCCIPTNEGPMCQQTDELKEQHYDESLTLFKAFLDPEYMAYTTAYYGETPDEILASKLTLEEAEKAKFELVCKRAGIQGHERIFNIGCGFGPLETYLFETYPDIEVTSITPSEVQVSYIHKCIQDANHPLSRGNLRLIKGDFSAVPLSDLGENSYDMVLAVGAFEHINNLHAAFQRISLLLKPGGTTFLHLITSNAIFPQYHDSKKTLIGKFFPGGHVWPFELMEKQGDFFDLAGSWHLNGMNYWRTLDEWHRRYWENMEQLYEKVLPDEAIRHWNDYFIQCKVVLFAPMDGEVYGNGHFLFNKKDT